MNPSGPVSRLAQTATFIRGRRLSWRVACATGVLLAYLVLAGEAIHCRYFVGEHDQHGTSQSQGPTHATHCLAANHGATAIPAVASLGADPLPPLGHPSPIDFLPVKAADVGSQSARAPPTV
ncbi:MAG: hypothetical protein ABIO65_13435 [Nitrospiria bacterium]